MARQSKDLPDITKHDPLEPFDITQIGNADTDPCFGKSYDLTTKECRVCGDSELCAFKMSQELNITRRELEAKNKYKDLDMLEDIKGIKKYIRGLMRKDIPRKDIIEKTVIKFETPKNIIRKIYKELKNGKTK